MPLNCGPEDMRARRKLLRQGLQGAAARLDAYCLLSDLLIEHLEAIDIPKHCPGACGTCGKAEDCPARRRMMVLEASIAELCRNLSKLNAQLGHIGSRSS